MSGTTLSTIDNGSSLVSNSLLLVQDFLQEILFNINALDTNALPHQFHWNTEVSALTTDISTFVELTTLLSKVMLKHNLGLVPEIKESHIHLLFIMKAMNQAVQKQDLVVLEELIKYELKDNLTQWKIDLIPQMKRLLNL